MDQQTENLSDLDRLIETYQTEQKQEDKGPSEAGDKKDKSDVEASANLASWFVRATEFGFKAIDSRVSYADSTYKEGRDALAPIFEKFDLGVSTDRVPYGDEIAAGWFLGKLFKSSWLQLCELWAADEKRAKNGSERENRVGEQARTVVSEERAREVNRNAQSGDCAESGGEGGFVGSEPRS